MRTWIELYGESAGWGPARARITGHPGVVARRQVADEQEAAEAGMAGPPTLLINLMDPFAVPGQAPGLSYRLYRDSAGQLTGHPRCRTCGGRWILLTGKASRPRLNQEPAATSEGALAGHPPGAAVTVAGRASSWRLCPAASAENSPAGLCASKCGPARTGRASPRRNGDLRPWPAVPRNLDTRETRHPERSLTESRHMNEGDRQLKPMTRQQALHKLASTEYGPRRLHPARDASHPAGQPPPA